MTPEQIAARQALSRAEDAFRGLIDHYTTVLAELGRYSEKAEAAALVGDLKGVAEVVKFATHYASQNTAHRLDLMAEAYALLVVASKEL